MSAIRIPAGLSGPAASANGGIAAGCLARLVPGTARVRLHRPPPLNEDLRVRREGELLQAYNDRDEVVLSAAPGDVGSLAIPDVGVDRARAAGRRMKEHGAASCVVCGPAHPRSLRVLPSPLDDDGTVACSWQAPAWTAAANGTVRSELVWGVLDCPGGWAISTFADDLFFPALGTITAELRAPVAVGEEVVVLGWYLGGQGRRHDAGTALLGADGEVRAVARQTCVAMPLNWASGSPC